MSNTITAVVDKVFKEEGESKKTGKPWTRWDVKTRDGERYPTFKKALGEAALALEGKAADLTYSLNGEFKNLDGIKEASGDQKELLDKAPTRPALPPAERSSIEHQVALYAASGEALKTYASFLSVGQDRALNGTDLLEARRILFMQGLELLAREIPPTRKTDIEIKNSDEIPFGE